MAESSNMTSSKTASASKATEFIKWFSLFFLIFQNSGAALLMRYVRSVPGHSDWHSQTGVVCQEALKAFTCLVVIFFSSGFRGLSESFSNPTEVAKTIVPAIFYLVQNNLQYVATGLLPAATYTVLYQLKILSTAFLSVLILGKELKAAQWIAISLLTAGVSLVSLSKMEGKTEKAGAFDSDFMLGSAAVLTATLCSGMAGVYFEKMLKQSKQSLWQRNLVLALYSIGAGLAGLYFGPDKDLVLSQGFFHGYTPMVWTSIANNALGGMLIAAVMKYADNILKNFACGFSIMLTVIASFFLFGDSVSTMFASGVAVVVYSVLLYSGSVPFPFVSSCTAKPKSKIA